MMVLRASDVPPRECCRYDRNRKMVKTYSALYVLGVDGDWISFLNYMKEHEIRH